MKIFKKQLRIEALSEKFLNIGRPSKERNRENLDTLISTPSKQDHINLEKAYQNLRNGLLTISNVISKGGKVLVYHKNGNEITKPLGYLFTKQWSKGLISNFKNIGKKHRVFPSLIVVASNDKIEQEIIAKEVNNYKVGAVFVTNTDSRQSGLINIPGNTGSDLAMNSLVDLFKRAITLGLLKEVAKIDPRTLKRYTSIRRLKLYKYHTTQKQKLSKGRGIQARQLS